MINHPLTSRIKLFSLLFNAHL